MISSRAHTRTVDALPTQINAVIKDGANLPEDGRGPTPEVPNRSFRRNAEINAVFSKPLRPLPIYRHPSFWTLDWRDAEHINTRQDRAARRARRMSAAGQRKTLD
jgi:hypothetical protein